MNDIVITRDTWPLLIDEVHSSKGKDIPDWQCFAYYNVCLSSVITPFSVMAWNLYGHLNGLKAETYESFMRLPAVFVDCVQVIKIELGRIQEMQQREDHQRAEIARRRANANSRR